MANKGGWHKNERGKNFFKFENPGDTLIGRFQGTREGKFGKNGLVKDKNGDVQEFSLNTAIEEIAELEVGTPLKLVYTGRQKSKSGRSFKAYDFFTWDAGKDDSDPVSEFTESEAPPEEGGVTPESEGDNEEVPF